jgi:hypothetical protein
LLFFDGGAFSAGIFCGPSTRFVSTSSLFFLFLGLVDTVSVGSIEIVSGARFVFLAARLTVATESDVTGIISDSLDALLRLDLTISVACMGATALDVTSTRFSRFDVGDLNAESSFSFAALFLSEAGVFARNKANSSVILDP